MWNLSVYAMSQFIGVQLLYFKDFIYEISIMKYFTFIVLEYKNSLLFLRNGLGLKELGSKALFHHLIAP